MGHTCYPYENGDVAWLGDRDPDSLFPNLTFEDPEGAIASLIAERWPAVRSGAGRAGLYPDALRPEDRLAIGRTDTAVGQEAIDTSAENEEDESDLVWVLSQESPRYRFYR